MLRLLGFLLHYIPLILSWIYLLAAILGVVSHTKRIKNKEKIKAGQWAFAIFNACYVLFFIITLIFFREIWELIFSVLGLITVFVSMVKSRYEDMCNGKRWWNW